MENYMKTLSQVLQILNDRGINKEFSMTENGEMQLEGSEKSYQSNELKIVKTYRFEGASSAGDNAVLYVIETSDGAIGTLIDAYGAESNFSGPDFIQLMKSIKVEERTEFDIE